MAIEFERMRYIVQESGPICKDASTNMDFLELRWRLSLFTALWDRMVQRAAREPCSRSATSVAPFVQPQPKVGGTDILAQGFPPPAACECWPFLLQSRADQLTPSVIKRYVSLQTNRWLGAVLPRKQKLILWHLSRQFNIAEAPFQGNSVAVPADCSTVPA